MSKKSVKLTRLSLVLSLHISVLECQQVECGGNKNQCVWWCGQEVTCCYVLVLIPDLAKLRLRPLTVLPVSVISKYEIFLVQYIVSGFNIS